MLKRRERVGQSTVPIIVTAIAITENQMVGRLMVPEVAETMRVLIENIEAEAMVI